MKPAATPRSSLIALFGLSVATAPAACASSPKTSTPSAPAADAGADQSPLPPIVAGVTDPRAFGQADLSQIAFAAFSQVPTQERDPQVLDLSPDLLPRAWQRWDNWGVYASDYDLGYPAACHAKGITFVAGTTASVMFADEVSAADFQDQVSRDAKGNPVPHPEVAANAYRGSLASPGYRRRLIAIGKLQIDHGVDGLHFDEVLGSYTGASWVGGNEGFDDYHVADFGAYLCAKYAGSPDQLATVLGVSAADGLDCAAGGRGFDYRGYLARHGASSAPLAAANPLAPDWGTTTNNRPDPAKGTFLETYPTLVYWQQIVVALRTYARETLGREILISANGIFPFVDFQTVGLYDGNHDGPGNTEFDWVPVKAGNLDGSVSFRPVLESLKARSKRIVEGVGGTEVPIVLFLDWPTGNMSRYYALPAQQRQDYFRLYAAEAAALGMLFAVPLATTTDANTATALGMMDFFKGLASFYKSHAVLYRGAQVLSDVPVVSAATTTNLLARLPDGGTVLHIINHAYGAAGAGIVSQPGVSATFPVPAAPRAVTLVSPDLAGDVPLPFTYADGRVSVAVGDLAAYDAVVVE